MEPVMVLDLFCGAGGAAFGLHQGLEDLGIPHVIVGVDMIAQPHYPAFHNAAYSPSFAFIQEDVLKLQMDFSEFDFIWASPPCQGYSQLRYVTGRDYPLLIEQTRLRLHAAKRPYVIENVTGARKFLINPLMLCGTMFDLRVKRHRYFECEPMQMMSPFSCNHWGKTAYANGQIRNRNKANGNAVQTRNATQTLALAPFLTVTGHDYRAADGRIAMGIPWMTREELSESIPPAYARYIIKTIVRQVFDAA